MRVAALNRKKFTKTPYFGGSRSFKVINVDIHKKLVASACYDKQHVCVFLPLICGDSLTQQHEILSRHTRDSKLSYGKNPKSISPGLGTVPGCDEQTDRQNYHN